MTPFKVVVTDSGFADLDLETEQFRESGLDIDLVLLNAASSTDLLPHVEDADALMVQWAKINRTVIERLQKCKVISRFGIGVDMIDLAVAGEHGIIVCNTPDYCIEEVSTHTIGFLLMLNRHIMGHHQHVRSGQWASPPGGAPARLSNQTLGIIGLGNIGRAVTQKARCFGVKVLVYDPYIKPVQASESGAEQVELSDLLQRADYVTIHCPLNDETRHLIGKTQLEMMKPTAYLINMARGPIVDQGALYQALVGHKIAGAAVDVLEVEPPPADEALIKLDNVIFTPHTSSWTAESVVQLRRDAAQNVIVTLQGKQPRSIVNRKALSRLNG